MITATLVTAVKTSGVPRLTARTSSAPRPMAIAGATGALRRGSILDSVAPAGSALSRAMANISRAPAACTANAQTVIATTMQTRNALPSGPPSACSTISCRPPEASPSAGSDRSGAARMATRRIRPPMTKEAVTARRIAVGPVRRGSSVSSPSELAVSKPYIT